MINNRQIEEGECSRDMQNMQNFQEELQFQQQYLIQQLQHNGGGREYDFSQVSPMLQPWSESFLIPPPPMSYPAGFFNRAAPSLQFAYDGSSMEQLRILSNSFGVQAEIDKMTAQEIMDAKALAASKSHSEAERRRRERINNHLAKLRTLLPSTTKTDKASLLAEVIQHVKELKRQTSLIAETNLVPTENDELIVDASDDDGKFVIRASICCDDRSDLLPDLIKTLKSLRLRTLKAEITTMGGRTKNVLFITGDDDSSGEGEEQEQLYCISSIQEALKAVMEKTRGDDSNNHSTVVKRQRTSNVNTL